MNQEWREVSSICSQRKMREKEYTRVNIHASYSSLFARFVMHNVVSHSRLFLPLLLLYVLSSSSLSLSFTFWFWSGCSFIILLYISMHTLLLVVYVWGALNTAFAAGKHIISRDAKLSDQLWSVNDRRAGHTKMIEPYFLLSKKPIQTETDSSTNIRRVSHRTVISATR